MGTCTIQNMVLITGSSIPLSIEIIAYVCLAIGFACALYIIYDIWVRRHYQMMSIMNVVWPITAWYLGPLALWLYWHIGHLDTRNHRKRLKEWIICQNYLRVVILYQRTTTIGEENHFGNRYSSLLPTVAPGEGQKLWVFDLLLKAWNPEVAALCRQSDKLNV
jgi:hypothetical protein